MGNYYFFCYLFAAFAEYILVRPSDDYAPFMNAVAEKICMSKVSNLERFQREFYAIMK